MAFPTEQQIPETSDSLNPQFQQEEIGNQQQLSEPEGNVQDGNPPYSAGPPTLPPRPVIESERFVTIQIHISNI